MDLDLGWWMDVDVVDVVSKGTGVAVLMPSSPPQLLLLPGRDGDGQEAGGRRRLGDIL